MVVKRRDFRFWIKLATASIFSSLSEGLNCDINPQTTQRCSMVLSPLRARPYFEDSDGSEFRRQKEMGSTDRPTQTQVDAPPPDFILSKPKIVVLGASGLIGRLVVRQLLESNLDATIVAFVRDYDKACRVLYDDLVVCKTKRKGPKLQIVKGELIPPEELPGYVYVDEEEEAEWLQRAKSAAAFYGNAVSDFDNRDLAPDPDEALQEAILGATTIISCVGSVRPSNLWTDFLVRPLWRILQSDVSKWCNDCRHPYYAHYRTTKKALELAEKEQLKREAAASAIDDEEKPVVPRIRFVRVSDLCVAQEPWQLVPLLTNALHSMVFRYQDMAEKILEASHLIDTVTLRPGDLVDEERNATTTTLQVDPSGQVPFPARIGREDVAALAVAAALFQSENDSDESNSVRPFHYTFGCRWASECMDPYPAQGKKIHGFASASLGIQSAVNKLKQKEKRRRKKKDQARDELHSSLAQISYSRTIPRPTKPYGICVAIPVYLLLSMMAKSIFMLALPYIPGLRPLLSNVGNLLQVLAAFTFSQLSQSLSLLPKTLPKWMAKRCTSKYITF
jgi:hypothetical protein